MKVYDVYGMGNALVDIIIQISEADFQGLDLERATMRLVDIDFQKGLLERFHSHKPHLSSGGSVANSVIAAAQLGGRAAFCGCIADDKYGLFYKNEFEAFGIDMPADPLVGENTGTCVVVVTPDAERTMRTCLAASALLSPQEVDEETIRRSKWLFIEGYLFSNPGKGQDAILKAVELARKHDCKIAVTFSEAWVIDAFGEPLRHVVEKADLVFANESEACAYTGTSDIDTAYRKLSSRIPNVALTVGERGAIVNLNGSEARVDAFPCKPQDLTGAGDMFAGSIFYGINHGYSARDCANAGCYLSSKVISQMGARLHSGIQDLWEEGLALRR